MKQPGAEGAGLDMARSSLSEAPLSQTSVSTRNPTGPRVPIENIFPRVDGGRYPVKRVAGESVEVWADIFREGHDVLAAALLWRDEAAADWQREPMRLHGNDRWHGHFTP